MTLRNSFLALMLIATGTTSLLAGMSQVKPTQIETEVTENKPNAISHPLTLYGNQDLPVFKNATVKVKEVLPGDTAYPLLGAGVIGLISGCGIFRNGTKKLVKRYPLDVQRIYDEVEAAQVYDQMVAEDKLARQQALAASPIPLESVEKDLAHLTTLKEIQAEGEVLAAKIELAKLRKELEKIEKGVTSESDPKEELLELLKEHEGGWLNQIIKGNRPLIFYAAPGAGKTTTANALLLAKKLIYGCEPILVADVHAHKNVKKTWKYLQQVCPGIEFVGADIAAGTGEDWKGYLDKLDTMPKYFAGIIPDENTASNEAKTSSFWDENTKAKTEAINLDRLGTFSSSWQDCFTSSRKGLHWIVIGLHNFTSNSVPDGCYDMVRKSSNRLELYVTPDNLPTFTGKFWYIDEFGQEVSKDVTIPDWLDPKKLVKRFNTK